MRRITAPSFNLNHLLIRIIKENNREWTIATQSY